MVRAGSRAAAWVQVLGICTVGLFGPSLHSDVLLDVTVDNLSALVWTGPAQAGAWHGTAWVAGGLPSIVLMRMHVTFVGGRVGGFQTSEMPPGGRRVRGGNTTF